MSWRRRGRESQRGKSIERESEEDQIKNRTKGDEEARRAREAKGEKKRTTKKTKHFGRLRSRALKSGCRISAAGSSCGTSRCHRLCLSGTASGGRLSEMWEPKVDIYRWRFLTAAPMTVSSTAFRRARRRRDRPPADIRLKLQKDREKLRATEHQ